MSRRNQAASRSPGEALADATALADAAPAGRVSGMDAMLEAKLWRNPCWLAFRVNYLALRYNGPLYDWVRRKYGLSRPEYVVIYSLALSGGGQARDITRTSSFPKNTLSRAITRLESLGLIVRSRAAGQGRNQPLNLSETGRALFDESLPVFVEHERAMLSGLTDDERAILSRLMAKVVLGADDWPNEIADDAPAIDVSGKTR
jgi:DNA-binding MarR family transcriptional regulator